MPKLRKLPDAELEVMLALWRASEPVPRTYFEKRLEEKNWSPTTINTYLSRLMDKGFVACERRVGRVYYYTPLVREEDYAAYEGRSLLDKLYGSSMSNFMAALCHAEPVTDQEIDKLQTLLDELKGRSRHA